MIIRLTERQLEVMALIAKGRSDCEIAIALGVRTQTVRNHIKAIIRRLGVRNRTSVAVYYITGWLPPGAEERQKLYKSHGRPRQLSSLGELEIKVA